MRRTAPLIAAGVAWVAGLVAAGAPQRAHAHAVAGDRLFPVTLTIDDPGVADEASLPTAAWQRSGADGGQGPVDAYTSEFEIDKLITQTFAVGLEGGVVVRSAAHGKTRTGFEDVSVSLRYQAYVDPDREFIVSVGLVREFGRIGTARVGADEFGSTTPAVFFGKGFPELPPLLSPLALTGTLGFSLADKELKVAQPRTPPIKGVTGMAAQAFNNGDANRLTGGLSVQYSIPYLQSQVRDYGLPEAIGRMFPLFEVAWSSPTSRPSGLGTQTVFAPGVIYEAGSFQVGAEALIPANQASGTHVGVIVQLHLFFDDILPDSLGRPLVDF